ncbi:MAG: ATP-binding protein [Candidatus Micrarchaeota archaeon]
MKELLKKLIAEGWDSLPAYVSRNRIPPALASSNSSIVIIGPRRAGKSYTAYEIKDRFLKKPDQTRDFIYLNFEDERLSGFKSTDFRLILDAYHELRDGKPMLILDEIHLVDGWDKFARRLADSGHKVVASGSNSKMLSREIAGTLGGRFSEAPIFPLNFSEFLKFRKIAPGKEHLYSKERFRLMKEFDIYLNYGGFPQMAPFTDEESRRRSLETYFNLVFYKDVIARHKLENEQALRFIIVKMRENVGQAATSRSVYSAMLEAGIAAGPNTVEKYLDYLEEAFLLVPCPPFVKSAVRQERRKRYFVDNGYIKLLEVKEDAGKLLENQIFMELVKEGRKVWYHRDRGECDFITDLGEAIQVTHELAGHNRRREFDGLKEAMDACKLKSGVIVTYGQEEQIDLEGIPVKVIPAWKWCLERRSLPALSTKG